MTTHRQPPRSTDPDPGGRAGNDPDPANGGEGRQGDPGADVHPAPFSPGRSGGQGSSWKRPGDDCPAGPARPVPRHLASCATTTPCSCFRRTTENGHQTADELACPLAQWSAAKSPPRSPRGTTRHASSRTTCPGWSTTCARRWRTRRARCPRPPSWRAAGEALQAAPGPGRKPTANAWQQDLERLQAALPARGSSWATAAMPRCTCWCTPSAAASSRGVTRFRSRVDDCIRGLQGAVRGRMGKIGRIHRAAHGPRQRRPEGERFDPGALSAVMDHSRGTRKMSPERRERIEQALAVLEAWQPDPVLVRFVHMAQPGRRLAARATTSWTEMNDTDPCARATELFDEQAAAAGRSIRRRAHRPAGDRRHVRSGHPRPLVRQLRLGGLLPGRAAAGAHGDRRGGRGPGGRRGSALLLPAAELRAAGADPDPGPGPATIPAPRPDEDPFQSLPHRTRLSRASAIARRWSPSPPPPGTSTCCDCYLAALDATRTSLHLINTGLRPEGTSWCR